MSKRQPAPWKPPRITRGEATGIYTPVRIAPASDDIPDVQRYLLDYVFPSLDATLDNWERAAQSVVDHYACPRTKAAIARFNSTGQYEPGICYNAYNLSLDAPRVAWDAAELLEKLSATRDCLKNNRAADAVWNALDAGRAYERMFVRRFEPVALTGRKVKNAAKRGHAEVHGTAGAKSARWLEYCREVDARRKPGMKLESICAQVARKFNVAVRTIYRALARREKSTDTARHCQ